MSTPTPQKPGGNRRAAQIALIVILGVLALTAITLTVLQFVQIAAPDHTTASTVVTPTQTPIPVVTPTDPPATPTPTPAATVAPPKPVDRSTRFTGFSAVTQVKCDVNSDTKPLIRVSWSSAYAVSAWYTANGGDAATDRYMQIPLSGTQDNFTDNHLFDCFHRPSQEYTITLVAPNGQHISRHWTVTNVGDQ
ncbi:MAG TPA: hypothetical protein VHZ81_02160 [Galbitalea sp.]|nr:hypothetical protein [Galbitalea sp.]